jgi:hypothetical protein
MIKKYLVLSFLLTLILLPAISFAATGSAEAQISKLSAAEQTRIANWKKRADTEIARRLTSLGKLTTKIDAISRLSASQKSSFDDDIASQIQSLTTLKTKVDADTDITTLRADVQSIVDSYRVYLLYIPKIHVIAAGDAISTSVKNLQALEPKIETVISGIADTDNKATAENEYTDFKAKIASAQTEATDAINSVINLTPDGYPGNKSTLQTAFNEIISARKDLLSAIADARNIVKFSK